MRASSDRLCDTVLFFTFNGLVFPVDYMMFEKPSTLPHDRIRMMALPSFANNTALPTFQQMRCRNFGKPCLGRGTQIRKDLSLQWNV